MHKLRIMIADDNPAFLNQMITLLGAEFDVVATAEDGRIALAKALKHRPGVVVLDLEMPFLNGIEITRELSKLTPAPAIVICSVESDQGILIRPERQARWPMFSKCVWPKIWWPRSNVWLAASPLFPHPFDFVFQ